MILKLSLIVSIHTNYISKRGTVYQFVMRVPKDLIKRFGCGRIRESLNTKDEKEALRKAEALAQRYRLQFKALSENEKLTPADVSKLAAEEVPLWEDLSQFIEHVVEPKRDAYAWKHGVDGEEYYELEPVEFLTPVEIETANRLREGKDVLRLSGAVDLYLRMHKKCDDALFKRKTITEWSKLVGLVGDVAVVSLTRAQANMFVSQCLSSGLKTASVRRILAVVNAVLNHAIREAELVKANPFEKLKIAGEGNDVENTKVATSAQLKEIAREFLSQTTNSVALMILISMELGTRIGEVAGLGIDDVFLDHDIPHVWIRVRPWRSLKTIGSERRVPVVGVALEALKAAVDLPRNGLGLFEQYARPRGGDAASSAVNARLTKWEVTSHSFRHAMKDRLRAVGCSADICDAIQGHSNSGVAENYGTGHSLEMMRTWLMKVAIDPA